MVMPACTIVRCMPIRIVNDQAVEKTETFGITLGLGPRQECRVTLVQPDGTVEIRDDDGN